MKAISQMRRPLVGMVLALALGFFLQGLLWAHEFLWLGLSAFLLAGSIWFRERTPSLLLILLIAFLAAAYGAGRHSGSAHFLCGAPEPASLSGTVIDASEDSLLFHSEAAKINGRWYGDSTTTRVSSRGKLSAQVGDQLILSGRYKAYEKPFGGVRGFFWCDTWTFLEKETRRHLPKAGFQHLRERASHVLGRGLSGFADRRNLFNALILGERRALPDDLKRHFAHSGTLHIFAVSGLHVGVVASILIAALKLLGISRPHWGVFLIPLLFWYVMITGAKASALRAFIMATVYFGAPLFKRRPDPVSAIALSALILLLINPDQITDPGFLLSFMVVSGIVMVHRFVIRLNHGVRPPSWVAPLVAAQMGRPLHSLVRGVGLLAVTSLAAWLFSFPLSARFFNTISPVAIAGNMILVPLTFLIVLAGFLSLASAPFFPVASMLLNEAAGLLIGWLIRSVEWLVEWPGAYYFVRAPSLVVLTIWYVGLTGVFCGSRRFRRPAVLALLFSLSLWMLPPAIDRQDLILLRNGDAALWMVAQDRSILMVDGSRYGLIGAEQMLKERGENQLDDLWIAGRVQDPALLKNFCETFEVVPEFRKRKFTTQYGNGSLRTVY